MTAREALITRELSLRGTRFKSKLHMGLARGLIVIARQAPRRSNPEALYLKPGAVMMVASRKLDLRAAASHGLKTAFIKLFSESLPSVTVLACDDNC